MDIYWVVILVIIAAIVGAVITYFVRPKASAADPAMLEQAQNDRQKISQLESSVEEKDGEISNLSEQLSKLQQKITSLQDELKRSADLKEILQSGDEHEVISALQGEIEKLKKQLEDAEEEIEDLEDESSSNKKKYNDERKKLSEASARLEQCEKDLKSLQNDLDVKEEELANQSEKLGRKEEAINFVNEILTAKDADGNDVRELNQKVNEVEQFAYDELFSVFDQLGIWDKSAKQKAKDQVWQWANLQKKTWLRGKKVIAFVGEFSAGKTSIVNRILSQDDKKAPKLPVSSKATTAIATYISYGPDFNSQFTDPNGRLKNISRETFEKVNKEILQEVNVSSTITYFVMKYNNKYMKNLTILDTPGFNSNDQEDAQRTADVIKEADALFWVFDANTGEINQSSLNVIRKYLQDIPLYVVINKADTKSPGELNKLEKHIRETIQKNGIAVKDYLMFSQKESLDKLMATIQSVPMGNDKDAYMYELYALGEKARMQMTSTCDEMRRMRRQQERENESCLNELLRHIDEVGDLCEEVVNMPQKKEKFFGSDYYKMTKEEYVTFGYKLSAIKAKQDSIKNLSKQLQVNVVALHDYSKKVSESNKHLNLIGKALTDFKKRLMACNGEFERKYSEWRNLGGEEAAPAHAKIRFEKRERNNSTKGKNRVSGEEEFMHELTFLHDDYGHFTKEHIPMIINLAKGYHISPYRAVELATDLIDEDDYI